MASYSKIHLKDVASEAFLYSRGFHLVSSCSSLSNWVCDHISLFLPVDVVISTDSDIYFKIADNYRELGIVTGKKIALNSITKSLSAIIFPQEQTTQKY